MPKPRLLVAVAAAIVAVSAPADFAGAHAGGKVQLFLKDLQVEHTDNGYEVTAVIVDRDSGAAATGFSTTLEGKSADAKSFPVAQMTPASGGIYKLSLPADPGDWTVTLRSVAAPGTEDAVPLVDQKRVSFPAEHAAHAASGASQGGQSRSSAAGVIVAGLALVCTGAMLARRTRPGPVPFRGAGLIRTGKSARP